jgi:cardiolipin synthase
MAFELFLALCALIVGVLLFLVLFEPGLRYRIVTPLPHASVEGFLQLIGSVTDSPVRHAREVEVLTDGPAFYEAELAAIRAARSSVHIVAFIFHPSAIGDRFLAALTERAAAGVAVRVVVDAIGSFPTPDRYFDALRVAGGHVSWYQPLRWYTLKRLNNRTHREIVVVDGEVGFVGGAGLASHWLRPDAPRDAWRDTMLRVRGSLVAGLQTAFVENWVEANDELLVDPALFAMNDDAPGSIPGLVAIGTPSPARSSPARILFQLLLAGARDSIDINSPYFLPDPGARRELIGAVARGVRVRVITPGRLNNHYLARLASRRRYGELLEAGVEIHEYEPRMIHAKIMIVDGEWSVVGSTNFDSRSFDLNDEINLLVADRMLAADLMRDFEADRAQSRRITLADWRRRPLHERALATLGLLLERQE